MNSMFLYYNLFLSFFVAGRKFCFVVMRFWLLTTHNGPDDPEGTKIFRVASSEDGIPQKKIVTAVYEYVCHKRVSASKMMDY